jgi:hypothetical protein
MNKSNISKRSDKSIVLREKEIQALRDLIRLTSALLIRYNLTDADSQHKAWSRVIDRIVESQDILYDKLPSKKSGKK